MSLKERTTYFVYNKRDMSMLSHMFVRKCDAAYVAFFATEVFKDHSFSVGMMVKGKTLEEAQEIKNTQIAEELALPPVKVHCSVLAEDAIKAAVQDYTTKNAKD